MDALDERLRGRLARAFRQIADGGSSAELTDLIETVLAQEPGATD